MEKHLATFEEIKARDAEYVAGPYGRFNMCIAKGKGARCVSVEGKEYIVQDGDIMHFLFNV